MRADERGARRHLVRFQPCLRKRQKERHKVSMGFAEIRPQIEQLSHEEMVTALAFLRSRLREENRANQEALAQQHAEMDAGKKVRWEDLKQQLGLA